MTRDGTFGDEVVGDILAANEQDVYVGEAAAGTRLKFRLAPYERSGYGAALEIMHSSGLGVPFLPVTFRGRGGTGIRARNVELPLTGNYQMFVGVNDEADEPPLGDYEMKTRLLRKYYLDIYGEIPDGGGLADFQFGGYAGSKLKFFLGVDPGSLADPTITDIISPSGVSLLGAPTRRGRVELPEFGNYTVKLSGADQSNWVFKGWIRLPRTRGMFFDNRDGAPLPPDPDPDPTPDPDPDRFFYQGILRIPYGEAVLSFLPEHGAGDEFIFWPTQLYPRWSNPPGTVVLPSTDQVYDSDGWLVSYIFRTLGGAYAALVVCDDFTPGHAVCTQTTVAVGGASGRTTQVFRLLDWNAAGRALRYDEARTYENTGNTYFIEWFLVRNASNDVIYAQATVTSSFDGTVEVYEAWK